MLCHTSFISLVHLHIYPYKIPKITYFMFVCICVSMTVALVYYLVYTYHLTSSQIYLPFNIIAKSEIFFLTFLKSPEREQSKHKKYLEEILKINICLILVYLIFWLFVEQPEKKNLCNLLLL